MVFEKYGMLWYGMVWFGMVWYSMDWIGFVGTDPQIHSIHI
jgi:hypothetical protein